MIEYDAWSWSRTYTQQIHALRAQAQQLDQQASIFEEKLDNHEQRLARLLTKVAAIQEPPQGEALPQSGQREETSQQAAAEVQDRIRRATADGEQRLSSQLADILSDLSNAHESVEPALEALADRPATAARVEQMGDALRRAFTRLHAVIDGIDHHVAGPSAAVTDEVTAMLSRFWEP